MLLGLFDCNGYQKEFKYCRPECVPFCVFRCLREIKIGENYGKECVFELMEYLLKNRDVLKEVMIGSEVSPVILFWTLKMGVELVIERL